ncbi:MAG: hypothetical protein ACO34E_08550 [Limisphaerales bacterium]
MQRILLTVLLASFQLLAHAADRIAPARSNAFDSTANSALRAMTLRAQELKIQGVAVIAYIPGSTTQSWSSKMTVVGKMINEPSDGNNGANLLAIAYTKACEMAETLKNSGHAGRPVMTGETGWEGGRIRQVKDGYLIAAFSGGPSEEDLKVAQAGLDAFSD